MTLAVDLETTWIGGWLASEKLNGCRAYWDGQRFWTRGGNVIDAPKWFTRGLPNVPLDGEIWAGRDGLCGQTSFEVARVAVQHGGRWFEELSPSGHRIEFAVFDFPGWRATWSRRMAEAGKSIRRAACAVCVPFHRVTNPRQWIDFMLDIRRLGGEGAMFRNPEVTTYEMGRSENLLRLKFCK